MEIEYGTVGLRTGAGGLVVTADTECDPAHWDFAMQVARMYGYAPRSDDADMEDFLTGREIYFLAPLPEAA